MKEKSFWRKNELIEAALDEFSIHSFQNASLNKILKNAGIGKGKFYYHFKNKKELYLFLHELAYKVQIEFQDEQMREITGDYKLDFFENITLSAQIAAEAAVRFPKYLKLVMMFLKEEKNEDTKEIIEYVNGFRKTDMETGVEKLVNEAFEAGDLSDRFSKNFIIKILNHFLIHYNEIFGMDEVYDESKFLEGINNFTDFLKFGLGK